MEERNETQKEKDRKMQAAITLIPGMVIEGTRKDGRTFKGTVEKVSQHDRGTLVVVKIDSGAFKSFYLCEMENYHFSDFAF